MLCQSYSVPQGTINKNQPERGMTTEHIQAIPGFIALFGCDFSFVLFLFYVSA